MYWRSAFLVVMLALVPSSASALELTNVRITHGELGGTRNDSKFLPGDIFFIAFDMEGVTLNADGYFKYRMALELVDKANKPVLAPEPKDRLDFVPLGGNKVPGRAYVVLGLDQEPGVYNFKLTVTDIDGKVSKTLNKSVEVLKPNFGIVQVYTSVDDRGAHPAPTTMIIGQPVYVQFAIVGFDRKVPKADPRAKTAPAAQPNVSIEMHVVDEQGRATLQKPTEYQFTGGLDEKERVFTIRFFLPTTRVGKFAVKLKAKDMLSGKTSTFDLPIAVVQSAN